MSVGSIGGTYGLSGSGMDIDAMVTKLMTGQQAKTDALVQKKMVVEWQKTAYNTVYDDISNFRNTVFNYKLEGTLSPNKVSSSNTSVATVTANAGAAVVNHSLVVAQLASGVNLTSSAAISATQPPTLGTLATQFGIPTTSFNLKIANGTATSQFISINPQTDTINDVVSKFNNAGVNVKANYDSTLDRFFLQTNNLGSAAGISISSTVDTGTTDAGAVFIRKLNLFPNTAPNSTTNTGGFTTSSDTTDNSTTTKFSSATGLNAEFKLDGAPLSQASNTFSITDLTYSLTGVSPNVTGNTITEKLASGQATSVSVTKDVDTAIASIQSLVDSYNKILAELNGKVDEKRYKDFPPLTDAQKSVMKDADITAWEAKAKSGMLHNDPALESLVNTMRNAFSSPVSSVTGIYNSASSIGITTGNYTEGGKLYLNTEKLRTALNAKPDVLSKLFGASGTTKSDGTIDSNSQGIAGRLYDGIKTKMDQLAQLAGTTGTTKYDTSSSYAKRITLYNVQISNAADRFDEVQTAYYRKYNAMEVALQQLSSQSGWLSSMLDTSSS